jgi:glycosyltransferase involved in cell wall biosynthesis
MVTPRLGGSVGGVETHVREVGRRLVARGHDLTILAADETRALPRAESVDGIRVRRVPAWPHDRDWQLAPVLIPEILRRPADLVHVQSYHTAVAAVALATSILARRPTVLTFHSGGHSSRLRLGLRDAQGLALRPWLRSADALVAVSRFERDELAHRLHIGERRFTVIPNGADLGGPSDNSGEVQRRPGLLLSVGRLEAYKGHDRAIRALPLVRTALSEARLLIVGAGPDKARLRRVARDSGVEDAVDFVTVSSENRAEMQRLLASASAVTLLSDYESQGIAAFEARGVGTPVVVTDGSAYADLVRAGIADGVPRDAGPGVIASAILGAMNRSPLAPIELPTWDAATDALEALYLRVVRDRR